MNYKENGVFLREKVFEGEIKAFITSFNTR